MKTITVFTTTYNRAYCLHILYNCLLRQTSQDFLWLVVDDGSTDNTKELVQSWIDEGKIEIKYHWKPNGGMHTGHNAAYALIDTELNVCIDSDDYMPDDAIEKIIMLWRRDGSEKYAGLIGLDATVKGAIIGTEFPAGLKECTHTELQPRYGVICDKKLVHRTEVVKKYPPYPEFEGEKFVPLYLTILVDKDYPLLCYNEVFCIADYQDDGSTINIFSQYFKNPKGFSYSRIIEMTYVPFTWIKFKACIHYVATSIISKNWKFLQESPRKLCTFFAIPFGIVLYFYLLSKRNKQRDISKRYVR